MIWKAGAPKLVSCQTYMRTVGALTAVTGIAATYYLNGMPDPNSIPPIDLNDQSYVLEDGSRCSKLMPKGELLHYHDKDVRTLYDVFQRGIQISGDSPCLGTRSGLNQEYEWLTYSEVHARALAFGSWVLDQNIQPATEAMIGIFSINRVEWVITEQACSAYSVIPVALYDSLGDQAFLFIINQTELSIVVCDTASKANRLLNQKDGISSLQTIVVMDDVDKVDKTLADRWHVQIVSFPETLKYGKKNLKKTVAPGPDEMCMLCYTSGTTGNPKGVILTHSNMMAEIAGVTTLTSKYRSWTEDDVYISFLPLPHMFERASQQILFMHGSRIGFFRGDVKLLVEDIQALRPTVFAVVPRLLNKMYDKIRAGVQGSAVKSTLLKWALAAKSKEIKKFILRKDSIWDKILFRKIQALLGGRVEFIITGSAPIEQKVLNFMRCAFGCIIFEGYGQTEGVAGMTMTIPGEFEAGHVGPPLPCNFVKLVDVPEYDYYAKNGQGEVCGKGPNVSCGYYKDPEKTAETIDADCWLHTGDIGQWLPNGTLKIIDRKKNIFKLAQGEYIAPEKIEIVFCRSKYVAQAFVEGDSLEPYIMTVIVPDEEVMIVWAKGQGLSDSFKELCNSKSVKNMILEDINKIGRAMGLKPFELTRDIVLHSELFSLENELLTPTFKNKRPTLRKAFKTDIQKLYKKHIYTRQQSMQ